MNGSTQSVAVVTGASQGIGRATAIRLAADFSRLVLVARDRSKLEETAASVRATGTEALVVDADLSQAALARTVVDKVLATYADGVQVNSVLPGPVMTGRRESYLKHWASIHNMSVEEATERFPREAGIARYGHPEEIADLMAFLVSPAARWLTGSQLRMDGGEVKSL